MMGRSSLTARFERDRCSDGNFERFPSLPVPDDDAPGGGDGSLASLASADPAAGLAAARTFLDAASAVDWNSNSSWR